MFAPINMQAEQLSFLRMQLNTFSSHLFFTSNYFVTRFDDCCSSFHRMLHSFVFSKGQKRNELGHERFLFLTWVICRVKVTEMSSVAVKSDEIIEAGCDFSWYCIGTTRKKLHIERSLLVYGGTNRHLITESVSFCRLARGHSRARVPSAIYKIAYTAICSYMFQSAN